MLHPPAAPVPGRRRPATCDRLEPRRLFTTAALLADLDTVAMDAGLLPQVMTGDALYCTRTGTDGAELWRTDGTAAGTFRLEQTAAANLTALGNSVLYTVGTELWETDGTTGDARLVRQFQPGTSPSTGAQWNLYPLGSRLAVFFDDGSLATGLYVTDGTSAGTTLISEGLTLNYLPQPPVVQGGGTDFIAAKTGLWRTDGTAAGTVQVTSTIPAAIGAAGGQAVYLTYNSAETQVQLWSAAPTTAAPTAVKTFGPYGSAYLDATGADLADRFTFSLTTQANGTTPESTTLWTTDGTAAGTTQVAAALPTGLAVDNFVAAGPRAYFTIASSAVWVTDGTAAGTVQVMADPAVAGFETLLNIAAGEPEGSAELTVTYVTSGFFFSQPPSRDDAYYTDGTATNTIRIAQGPADTAFSQFVLFDGGLYMTATTTDYTFSTPEVSAVTGWATADVGAADSAGPFNPPTDSLDSAVPSPVPDPAAVPVPTPPTAALAAPTVTANAAGLDLAVTYADANGVADTSLADPATIVVTGADGTDMPVAIVSTVDGSDPTRRTVTYRWTPAAGSVTWAADGTYTVTVATADVTDVFGAAIATGPIGTFSVALPVVIPAVTGPGVTATVTAVTDPAIGGQRGTARVRLTNVGPEQSSGTATLELTLSTAAVPNVGTTEPITLIPAMSATVSIRLRALQSRTITIRFAFPATTGDGTGYVLAALTGPDAVPAVVTASPAVRYRAASVDLSATAAAAKGRAGKRATVVLRVHNGGSVTAAGSVSYALSLSGGSLASAITLPALPRTVSIKAGATKAVPLPFVVPAGLAAGTYTLTVSLAPATSPADDDAADKSVAVTFAVVG